jgi:23S rRNA (adenine-N6)-dimethyltransferase
MFYRQKRLPIYYSQNFLQSRSLVEKLVRLSSIGKNDTVLDIGAGKGIITSELLKTAKRVISLELDNNLYTDLKNKFRNISNSNLVHENILYFKLPTNSFKVFSNIPFNITSDIIKKLTSNCNFQEGFFIMQKEAARKFIGMPCDIKNSMVATLLKPWFELSIFWQFNRFDFSPTPNVDVVMLKIVRRCKPLINKNQEIDFRDFIVYTYTRSKIAKLKIEEILVLYDVFKKTASSRQKMFISKEANRFLINQNNINKIHRTRIDPNWRKY